MTVNKFLQKYKGWAFLGDLLTLLEEFDEEKCSVLAGKIKARLQQGKRQLQDTDFIDLCTFLDKLDATGNTVYATQFNELLEDLSRETGLSIPEIKNRTRAFRDAR